MLWLFLVSYLAFGQCQLDQETQAKINAFVEQTMSCRNMVGAGLAIVQNGQVVFTNGYGVKDLASQEPVTSTTLFNIASATKQFTATLLGKVLRDNGLSWDMYVRDVLGDNFYFYDGLRTSQGSLRDLASHRTGQPRRDLIGYSDSATRESAAMRTRFVKPISKFRSSYRYNNNMYDIMAYTVDVLTASTFEESMRQYIFNPLNMTSSSFIYEVNLSNPDLAQAYEYYEGGVRYVNNLINSYWARLGGSGSIVTNAVDLGQWLKLQLGKGTVNSVEIIPKSVIDETHKAANPMPQSSNDIYKRPNIPVTYARTEYGLGFQIGWYRGYTMVSHSGGLYGYGALITLLPDMNIGIALALNGADETYIGRRLIHMYVMDLLLGEEPWLNLTTACTFPEPWGRTADEVFDDVEDDTRVLRTKKPREVPHTKLSRAILEPYAGVYGDFFYGNISVVLNDTGHLLLYYGDVLDPWLLVPTQQDDLFFGEGLGITWPLNLDYVQFATPEGIPRESGQVTVDFDGSDPTVFTRGLTMGDAYPPPDPNYCNSATAPGLVA